MADEIKKEVKDEKDNNKDTSTSSTDTSSSRTDKAQETVVNTDDKQTHQDVDYKQKYNELLLNTSLEASPAMQALDLPKDIALDYFKKFFTVDEKKGKVTITGQYADSKLVDKEGKAVSVNDAVKFIVSKNKDLTGKIVKKAPGYKGTLKIANANIKDMSLTEKLAYRKQVGPSAYRSILAKQ